MATAAFLGFMVSWILLPMKAIPLSLEFLQFVATVAERIECTYGSLEYGLVVCFFILVWISYCAWHICLFVLGAIGGSE